VSLWTVVSLPAGTTSSMCWQRRSLAWWTADATDEGTSQYHSSCITIYQWPGVSTAGFYQRIHRPGSIINLHRTCNLQVKKLCIALHGQTHLRATGRHLPYGITCHPTQVNAPHLNLSQTGRYSIYLPRRMEGRVDLGSLITARPGIEPMTAWSQVRRPNRYATKPPK